MKIAVNAQTLVKDKMEGLGWFAFETLKRIVVAHPEHEFTFIFGKGVESSFLFAYNVKAVNIGPPFFRPMAWLIKYEFLLPRFVNNGGFDLYLSPDGWSSTRIKVKTVAVIHDINFEHFPKFLPFSYRNYYRFYFKRWVKHAKKLGSVSEYSKQDIVNTYKVSPDKIKVMYNGASPVYKPIDEALINKLRTKYTQGKAYFIFIGALHPRKNVINLFKAFDQFKKDDQQGIKLLIVGEKFYWDKHTSQAFDKMEFINDVVFTGRLKQEDLKNVLGASLALTYPSLFEGFGIPIVEAMNCNIPIITSNTTSMPEVAGDAALIVNPNDINSIAEAMHDMATKPEIRARLIAAGKIRRKEFSWDKTAEKLWDLCEDVF